MVKEERSKPNLGESGVKIYKVSDKIRSEKNSNLKNEREEGDVSKGVDETQLWVGVHLPHLSIVCEN